MDDEMLKYFEEALEAFSRDQAERARYEKENKNYEDGPLHVSHAEARVMMDPEYFPQDSEEPIDIDAVAAVVEKLKNTDYFGEVDESYFIDDTSAPERYTDAYRQWWEYHDAKGHYDLLGNIPSLYEWLYNNEFEHLHAEGKMDDDLYLLLKRIQ